MLNMGNIAALNGAVIEGFTEKVTFQQSSEQDEAMTHRDTWGKNFSNKEYTMRYNPEVGVCGYGAQIMLHPGLFANISPLYSIPTSIKNRL